MGLFGALYAGVSGLDSQSNKIGVISNNISNVNTVGYKQGQANFDTLVVPSGTTSFSPGGTIGGNTQLVNQQGTISATTSATDVALSGNGFFVVSSAATGVSNGGTPLYTRAGSFTQDSSGNFVNSEGYYLQGLPIQANGQPKDPNTQNLQTVSISQSATGSPTATSTVAIQANLNAKQAVLPGASETASMSSEFGTSTVNATPDATQIIIGNDYPNAGTATNNLNRGDSFSMTSALPDGTFVAKDTYQYNGFTVGRDITTAANKGDDGSAIAGAPFTGNILNATSATQDFITSNNSGMTTSSFSSEALHFTISVNGNTPVTLQYSSSPNPAAGTFNSLDTLAQAISDQPGLTATVQNNRLYLSATNPNQSVVVTNGDANTTNGINWVQQLGISNSKLTGTTPGSGTIYFNSLQSLANDINSTAPNSGGDPTNLTATVNSPNAGASLTITEANPEQTITFSDGASNQGSVLRELGFAAAKSTGPSASTPPATLYAIPTQGVTYNASVSSLDMSSGAVTPQYTKDITVYDSQGFSHTLALNFVKIATNTWGVEVTAVPASDVENTTTADGQLASGTITFTGTGSLLHVTGGLSNDIPINWSNGAGVSSIALDLGQNSTTLKDTASTSQTAGPSTVSQVIQNGAPTGELTGVTIDQNGFVIAAFSNGQTQKLYQVPLAVVNNPDGMLAVSGNAYQQTLSSGDPTLDFAGEGGAGTFTPSALEQSNVDLSTQLTNLIVAQQAYGANSKVLTVADTLLQQLDQIIQ